jgi:N-acetylglucosaminyldiphosphoundecaprenol N-acetyl-beta-D-mannosaminyltransferase
VRADPPIGPNAIVPSSGGSDEAGGGRLGGPTFAPLPVRYILGMRVDGTSYDDASDRILAWARMRDARYVCVATVNNVMVAHDDARFLGVMNQADLVTPDGMPLVWGLRLLGVHGATRVYGPDLTPIVLDKAERENVPVGFYGGSPEVLESFLQTVRRRWPRLTVAYAFSPPYRQLAETENATVIRDINESGARILFVGIGCPKQELWMAGHRDTIHAVTVGVGAAFDFISGRKRQAPPFLQRMGLEWMFRLATEPRRLWKRYLRHNPRFVLLFGVQLLKSKWRRSESNGEEEMR